MHTDGVHTAWKINEPWPATLVAYREGADAPDLEETLAGIAANLDITIDLLEIHGAPDEKRPFSVVLQIPELDTPVLLACERVSNSADAPANLQDALTRCQWVLIGETLLGQGDPLKDYVRLAKILAHDGQTLALLDASTAMWLDRATIDGDLLDETIPPPEDLLWRTRVVSTSAELDSGSAWLFTTGLLRCGVPELEMLEVPAARVHDAAQLMDIAAALILESGAPGSEIPLGLGEGIDVVLVPWQDAIETLGAESLGSIQDRENLGEHTPNPLLSTRVAICDVEFRGSFKQVRTWPEGALDGMDMEDAAVYASSRAAERQGALARHTWPRVVDAVNRADEGALIVFVGLSIATNPEGISEHGWIQVEELRLDGGKGRLLRDGGLGMARGTELEFMVEDMGGWRLLLHGEKALGPTDGIDPVEFAEGRW